MKPIVVADEMFPEGPGPFMDLEEVGDSLEEFSKEHISKVFNS